MAILKYSTNIEASQSIAEIQSCIVKRGARQIMTSYDDEGLPVGITFFILIKGEPYSYKFPSNYKGVLESMRRDKTIPRSKVNKEQALKVSWRILKVWIESQMAVIDAELASIDMIFLPYMVTRSGLTISESFKNNSSLLLNS